MIGWISLHRQIQSHWIWQDANKFKWWIDILLTVNNAEAKVNIGFEIFECKRGQSVMSIQSWAKRWNVSKDTARNFLKLLEKDKMISLENVQKSTRLTVCNYDSYQTSLHDKPTQTKRKPNATSPQPHPNNNEDNVNNENKEVYRAFKHLTISYLEVDVLLNTGYSRKQINDMLDGVENYSKNKQYTSLFLTTKKWLQREFPHVEQEVSIQSDFLSQL